MDFPLGNVPNEHEIQIFKALAKRETRADRNMTLVILGMLIFGLVVLYWFRELRGKLAAS